jgi:hypothetical protein
VYDADMNARTLIVFAAILFFPEAPIAPGKSPETGVAGKWATDCVSMGASSQRMVESVLTQGMTSYRDCPSGALTMKLEADVKKGKLSGYMGIVMLDKKAKIEDGRVNGSEFSFRTKVDMNRRVIESNWTGVVVNANVIHLKLASSSANQKVADTPMVFHRGR